jgi:hypothetical protein
MKKLSGGAFSAKVLARERTRPGATAVVPGVVTDGKMAYAVDKHKCNG